MAWIVRVLVFVVPVAAAWGAVRVLSPGFVRPAGWVGIGLWVTQALVVASGTASLVDRFTQRLLPLATLMGMSLTFPDQAPSRFGLALRTGTLTKLQARLDELDRDGLGPDVQQASVKAVELATLLAQHDRLTRGHTERVRAYADLIAVELGLNEADRSMLAWGVALHDVGKLFVPPEILNKNGRPTDDEWSILARHPVEGERLIQPLAGWLGEWVTAAAQHHERWDGTGYPRGLAGSQISLAGRITAVADAYDVITSRRSYKAPMSIAAARKELVDCAGTHFDPDIVRALLHASVRRRRRAAGLLSWLPEVPGMASVGHAVATAPAVLATAAVAVTAPLMGLEAPPRPTQIAYAPATTTPASDPTPNSLSASTTLRPSGSDTTASIVATDSTPTAPSTQPPDTDQRADTAAVPPPTSAKTPATTSTTRTAGTTTTPAPTTISSTTSPTTPLPAAPVAQDDTGTQQQGQQKQYSVLLNDTGGSAALDPSTLAIVIPPTYGAAEVWNSTKIRYTAAVGYTGTDSITYRICDLDGRCSQAVLTIQLTG